MNPGDFIFGDYDGVIVIPKELTVQVLVECERIIGIEHNARIEFARGDDILLEQRYSGELWAIPSPNGRQKAIPKSTSRSNIWMVENRRTFISLQCDVGDSTWVPATPLPGPNLYGMPRRRLRRGVPRA